RSIAERRLGHPEAKSANARAASLWRSRTDGSMPRTGHRPRIAPGRSVAPAGTPRVPNGVESSVRPASRPITIAVNGRPGATEVPGAGNGRSRTDVPGPGPAMRPGPERPMPRTATRMTPSPVAVATADTCPDGRAAAPPGAATDGLPAAMPTGTVTRREAGWRWSPRRLRPRLSESG